MKTRHIALTTALVLGFSFSSMAGITGMADINYWIGSGANSAAMVIDFHDGETTESFAWGYRWNGTASGADMLIAIASADVNLSINHFGDGDSGFYLTSVNYFDGIASHSEVNGNFGSYPADYDSWGFYLSGGFAGEDAGGDPAAIAGGGSALPGAWTSSPTGAGLDSYGTSGRILEDGAWDAWSFGLNNESYVHTVSPGTDITAAVPEPASALLIMLGSFGIIGFRRYKASIGA